jgi:hypothetical protein
LVTNDEDTKKELSLLTLQQMAGLADLPNVTSTDAPVDFDQATKLIHLMTDRIVQIHMAHIRAIQDQESLPPRKAHKSPKLVSDERTRRDE